MPFAQLLQSLLCSGKVGADHSTCYMENASSLQNMTEGEACAKQRYREL